MIDIAGPVSVASDAKPAREADLEESVRQIRPIRAAADRIETTYGKIDIVVADPAIQR